MLPHSVIALWILSCYVVFTFAVLLILLTRRHIQPIKFRGPWLLAISGLGGFICAAWLLLFLVNLDRERIKSHSLCIAGEWITWLAYPAFVLPYALRVYRLHRVFAVAESHRHGRQWTQFVVTEAFTLKWLFAFLLICTVVQSLHEGLNWNYRVVGYGCGDNDGTGWLIAHGVEVVVLGIVMFRLRHFRDDFGVATELLLASLIWIVSTLILFVLELVEEKSPVHDLFDGATISTRTFHIASASLNIARNVGVLVVSVVLPVSFSFGEPFVPLWGSVEALRSLDSLLKDIVCVQYFRNFLTSIGKVENICCWVEIELFADVVSDDDLTSQAARIYDKYLQPGAELEVKIDDSIKYRVLSRLQRGDLNHNVFGEVGQAIFQLMNDDFPLFLVSTYCRRCLEDLKREEHLRLVLENSEML